MVKETKGSPYIIAIFAGLLASVVSTNITRLVGAWETNWYYVILCLVYMAIGAKILTYFSKLAFGPLVTVYAMIPFGVVIDCTFDWFVWKNDRNLFPFEIIMQFIIVWVPMLLSVGIVKLVRSNNRFNLTQ